MMGHGRHSDIYKIQFKHNHKIERHGDIYKIQFKHFHKIERHGAI